MGGLAAVASGLGEGLLILLEFNGFMRLYCNG